jgi:hypothetical protein
LPKNKFTDAAFNLVKPEGDTGVKGLIKEEVRMAALGWAPFTAGLSLIAIPFAKKIFGASYGRDGESPFSFGNVDPTYGMGNRSMSDIIVYLVEALRQLRRRVRRSYELSQLIQAFERGILHSTDGQYAGMSSALFFVAWNEIVAALCHCNCAPMNLVRDVSHLVNVFVSKRQNALGI